MWLLGAPLCCGCCPLTRGDVGVPLAYGPAPPCLPRILPKYLVGLPEADPAGGAKRAAGGFASGSASGPAACMFDEGASARGGGPRLIIDARPRTVPSLRPFLGQWHWLVSNCMRRKAKVGSSVGAARKGGRLGPAVL